MAVSIALLLGMLAFCMLSMDLALSIVYRKLARNMRAAALIVFTATSLALVFFMILDSWSALSFQEGVYQVLAYIWTGLVIATGAFLLTFVPYFSFRITAKPFTLWHRIVFISCSALFVAICILALIFPSMALDRAAFIICLAVVFCCVVTMFRNSRGIEDRDVKILIRSFFIVGLSLLPVIISGIFIPFIRSISPHILFLAYSIVILVFLFVAIARLIRESGKSEEKEGEHSGRPDLSQYHITEREMDVIELVGQGLTNKEIAARLSLSVNTVNNHIANIFSKTGVRSRVDLLNLIHKGFWQTQN